MKACARGDRSVASQPGANYALPITAYARCAYGIRTLRLRHTHAALTAYARCAYGIRTLRLRHTHAALTASLQLLPLVVLMKRERSANFEPRTGRVSLVFRCDQIINMFRQNAQRSALRPAGQATSGKVSPRQLGELWLLVCCCSYTRAFCARRARLHLTMM